MISSLPYFFTLPLGEIIHALKSRILPLCVSYCSRKIGSTPCRAKIFSAVRVVVVSLPESPTVVRSSSSKTTIVTFASYDGRLTLLKSRSQAGASSPPNSTPAASRPSTAPLIRIGGRLLERNRVIVLLLHEVEDRLDLGVIRYRNQNIAPRAPFEMPAINQLPSVGSLLHLDDVAPHRAELRALRRIRLIQLPAFRQRNRDVVFLRPAVVEVNIPLARALGESRRLVVLEERRLQQKPLPRSRRVPGHRDLVRHY